MDELLRITYMLTDPVVMISVGDPYYQQEGAAAQTTLSAVRVCRHASSYRA